MEPKRPSNLEECTFSMSNFDHSIDGELEGALRTSRVYAQHAAWDFCGYVWFADGQFHEDVWQYRRYDGKRGDDVDRVPGVADPRTERGLDGERDPAHDEEQDRGDREVARELDVGQGILGVRPPVRSHEPDRGRNQNQPDHGVHDHVPLVGHRERHPQDGKSRHGAGEDEPEHQCGDLVAPPHLPWLGLNAGIGQ